MNYETNRKCKEDFEKWYFKNHCKTSLKYEELMPHHKEDVYGWFYGIDLSFKYGVYVDFFDSVGIFCEDRRYTDVNMAWVVKYPNFDGIQDRFDGLTKTRQEARVKAIEKANEIYNER